MILYQYRCPACKIDFEEMNEVEQRHYANCPKCRHLVRKVDVCGSSADVNFHPRWFYNIAPVPVYVTDRKQLTAIANKMNNYSNFPFTKMQDKKDMRPLVKGEKREFIKKLRRGQYD